MASRRGDRTFSGSVGTVRRGPAGSPWRSGPAWAAAGGSPRSPAPRHRCSAGLRGLGRSWTEDPEHRETGQVDRGREQREVGRHLRSTPHPGATATVVTTHELGDATLDLGSGGPVVGQPGGIPARGAGPDERGLVGSHRDAASILRGRAAGARGQAAQADPKLASAARRRRARSGTVSPAGQVTVAASRSMAKSSLLKRPPRATDGCTLMRGSAPAVSSVSSSAPLP